MGYHYLVELIRKVKPFYRNETFKFDTKTKKFPFGKGKEFKTGKEALKASTEYAESMLGLCSSVCISRLTDSGNGVGNYIKESDAIFDLTWEELEKQVKIEKVVGNKKAVVIKNKYGTTITIMEDGIVWAKMDVGDQFLDKISDPEFLDWYNKNEKRIESIIGSTKQESFDLIKNI